ncbi:MAG: hypothetical protein HY922_02290 [Elusimicrobia bacterium]|nr:hypothetical protein [Elusimicrobiota bacterium]
MKLSRLAVPAALVSAALCLTYALSSAQSTKKALKVNVTECPPATLELKGPDRARPEDDITLTYSAMNVSDIRMDDVGAIGESVKVKAKCCGKLTYTIRGLTPCGAAVKASKVINISKSKVYLSGSRYANGPSIADYMMSPQMYCPQCYGSTASGYVNSHANADQKAAFNDFMSKMWSWPRTVDAFKQAHVAGTTYVVDEDGNVLGSMRTLSIFDTGVPGLSYLGDPFNASGNNKIYIGNAPMTFNGATYDVVGFLSASPIILDLDNDGKPDVDQGGWLPHPTRFNKSKTAMFDINGDGFAEITEWIGSNDGLLVAPLKDGRVKGGNELFGNPIGFVDGYQKLGLYYDKDENAAVEGKELEGLMVWVDKNRDGKTEPEELRTLQEMGITKIHTDQENLKSRFVMNGQERSTWDWWPTCMLVYPSILAKAK